MDGIYPLVAASRVNFIRQKFNSRRLAVVRPHVPVSAARDAVSPYRFDLFAPTRLENLVEIGANANVCVFAYVGKREIPRNVEPPRIDDFRPYPSAERGEFSALLSFEPVSSTVISSASLIDLTQRSANADSFLQIAYTQIFIR